MSREGIIKHREVFDRWLEGAEIEYFNTGTRKGRWLNSPPSPSWHTCTEYRVKPKDALDIAKELCEEWTRNPYSINRNKDIPISLLIKELNKALKEDS